MPTWIHHFHHRKRLLLSITAAAASVTLLAGPALAASPTPPTLSPGQTVDLYTFTYSEPQTFTVSFSSAAGVYDPSTPTVSGSQLSVRYTPLANGGYSDRLQFTMPNLGVSSAPMDALIGVSGGAVVARFQPVQPPIYSAYGMPFLYDSAPLNSLPEVPLAGALPLGMIGLAGIAWMYRSRQVRAAH